MKLTTSRLIIRPFREEDLNDFNQYASNADVGPMAGWRPHADLAESKAILDSFIKQQEVFALYHIADQKVIGSIGLHLDLNRDPKLAREIGYVLSKPYWGRGLMVEAVQAILAHAFLELKLQILSIRHFPFNNQSKRVIEKCGFQYEGYLRKAYIRYDNQVLDSVVYSLTQEEYLANRGQ